MLVSLIKNQNIFANAGKQVILAGFPCVVHVCFISLDILCFSSLYIFNKKTSNMFLSPVIFSCHYCILFVQFKECKESVGIFHFLCFLIWSLITFDWTTCQEEFSNSSYSCQKNIQWLHQRCFITTLLLARISMLYFYGSTYC